jgi:hypothetical protein
MLSAEQVLQIIADNPHVMGVLDGGACAVQHVSRRVTDGPDERLDSCPCDRKLHSTPVLGDVGAAEKLRELGNGHYVSSPTHTYADLVRDALGQ